MTESTPGNHVIFLLRDPRDVVASRLDAFRSSGWAVQKRDYSIIEKLNEQATRLAKDFLRVVSKVEEAYEAHPTVKKALVRYEDLRADALGTVRAMYEALGMEAVPARLEAVVKRHGWDQVPEGEKGKNRFFRKAKPGGWREDPSPEQVGIIEEVTAPLLSRYLLGAVPAPQPGSGPLAADVPVPACCSGGRRRRERSSISLSASGWAATNQDCRGCIQLMRRATRPLPSTKPSISSHVYEMFCG